MEGVCERFKPNRLKQESQDIAQGKRGYPQQTRGLRQSFLVVYKKISVSQR